MLPFNSGLVSQCYIAVNISSVACLTRFLLCDSTQSGICQCCDSIEIQQLCRFIYRALTLLQRSESSAAHCWEEAKDGGQNRFSSERSTNSKSFKPLHPKKHIQLCKSTKSMPIAMTEWGRGSTALAVIDPKSTPRVVNWDHPSCVD